MILGQGLAEKEMNCVIVDRPRTGRPKYTEIPANLETDIRSLVDPNTCTHRPECLFFGS
jgi:hypothetical protein